MSKNYNRHLKSKIHLEKEEIQLKELNKWAKENGIYNYNNLSKNELENLQDNFNDLKDDYNLYEGKKLRKIGENLYVNNLENLTRIDLIKTLEEIKKKIKMI